MDLTIAQVVWLLVVVPTAEVQTPVLHSESLSAYFRLNKWE
jgi:hypothetical protein